MSLQLRQLEAHLLKHGADPARLEEARVQADRAGLSLVEAVQRTEAVPAALLARAIGEVTGLPVEEEVDIDQIDVELVRRIPLSLSREQGVLPLWEEDGRVLAAIANPGALSAVADLRVLFRMPVKAVIVPADTLRDLTNSAFDRAARSAAAVMEDIREDEDDDMIGSLDLEADILDDPNQAPIIRFVNTLLTQAIKDRASDIHIEPFEKELVVRFRIDGVLYEIVKPPPRLQASIVSRVKIMAGLNIAERRIPQDGRIRIRMAGREIDLRVSTLPVRHGERVVMRILEKGAVFSLDTVGMAAATLEQYRRYIRKPHGIVLVTGPTGSGKTTTLYSGLAEINSPELNILTIEDPIEYELKGIGQTQVNPKIDLTFASALRAHLRQDPDVIMVGEIRDKETAENAVQASLTGHLVFSTLHTNDAPGAFTRLTDMGVEPFLVSSTVLMVLAQRLVRRLCPDCKEAYVPSDVELADISLGREAVTGSIYRAKGCKNCLNTGYRGRTGIYELLPVGDAVRHLVMDESDASTIKRAGVAEGMKTLRDDGLRKVLLGETSVDEVLRVTQEDAVELDQTMAVYEYKGIDGAGKAVSGIIDADGPKGARTRLRKQGVYPTEVEEQVAGRATKGTGLSVEIDFGKYFQRVGTRDIATFTSQLSTLIGASIPMVEALGALQEQVENQKLKIILADVREKVNEGGNLGDALANHPKVFNDLYVNMVRAGEASGSLDVVLLRLTDYTETQLRLKGKVTSALMYPILMMLVSGVIVLGLFVFVIPRIRRILDSFGEGLPLITQFTLGLSDLIVNFWWLMLMLAGVGAWGFRRWKATESGTLKWDRFMLRMPIFGRIFRLVAISRFCRTLATLLVSGVPILTALGIVKDVVQNEVLATAIREATRNIAEGQSVAVPLKASGEFPPLVTHMITVGERTGELEGMLSKIADSYDLEMENTVNGLTSLLEPLLTLFMGGVVTFVALAVLLPMLNMSAIAR